jgi:hypothetical protein
LPATVVSKLVVSTDKPAGPSMPLAAESLDAALSGSVTRNGERESSKGPLETLSAIIEDPKTRNIKEKFAMSNSSDCYVKRQLV